MILTDTANRAAIERGEIEITPYNDACVGTNSYDVHIGDKLVMYDLSVTDGVIDVKNPPPMVLLHIPEDGFVLMPNHLYLGVTLEHTYTPNHVPIMHGKSSLARLGIEAHVCAGFGDVGFAGYWTLELRVVYPTRIYAGMKIAQIAFHAVQGEVGMSYDKKPSAKYSNQPNQPVASKFHENFEAKLQP